MPRRKHHQTTKPQPKDKQHNMSADKAKPDINAVVRSIADTATPIEHRKVQIIDLLSSSDAKTLEGLFQRMVAKDLDKETRELGEQLRGLVESMQRAPMPPAT